MSLVKLNFEQEKYAQLRASGVGPSDAGRQCWKWDKWDPRKISIEASKKEKHKGIAARIAELKAEIMAEVKPALVLTVEDLLQELTDAQKIAKTEGQSSAHVQATMAKAKLLGLDIKKIEHTGKNGGPIESASLSSEEFKALRKDMLDEC